MIICITEYEKLKIGKRDDKDKKIISTKTANALYELEKEKNKKLFIWGRNTVTVKNWIGVISVEGITLEILPKISSIDNKNKVINSIMNMVKKVYDVKIQKNISANIGIKQEGFIDILVYILIKELEYQLNRGILKEYSKVEKNLNVLKGRLIAHKNIQKNIITPNKFYCKYSELNDNNAINKIIKFTLNIVKSLNISRKYKSDVKMLLNLFEDVSINENIFDVIKTLKYNRQNSRFKESVNLCKMFIESYGGTLWGGEKNVNSFLIDMNDLFEKYIFKSFKEIKGLDVKYQGENKYLLRNSNNIKKIRLKPDITIINEINKKFIVDTKWKIIDKKIDIKDIYQMNAYKDIISDASEVILLFPKCNKNDRIVEDYFFSDNNEKKLKVRTIDILNINSKVLNTELTTILN
ncbi:TPA: McrC family protein [Clostridium perfringens]|uniref:McrC family protein n=1 Tax=Clostridium perfringens TaxID=1502 RepID=UPI000D709777|nr:hypothetical protein [Clostridium perfringens]EJT5931807.1 hypothetical protein [Clostridium perfringens]EJT6163069.1 hypothetical protein [Clostridium perfringens]EJT6505554.1 hypothetical protein [Clostridium perfringens]MBI6017320.1 hypothetical protein [Clostridium perfringens]MBI6081784.1 hypothetical protein [Clostridium perfringens]